MPILTGHTVFVCDGPGCSTTTHQPPPRPGDEPDPPAGWYVVRAHGGRWAACTEACLDSIAHRRIDALADELADAIAQQSAAQGAR